MNLHEKLKGIQYDLVAAKDAFNSFGKYNYRSCESILKALKPHLEQSNLVLTLSDDVIAVGERVYIKATATLSDGENSVSTTAFAREPLSKKGADESQVTGAASSYARKYALCGLFAIDDNKDADATNTHGAQQAQQPKPRQQPAPKQQKPYYTDEQLNANMAAWQQAIAGGKTNVGALLAKISAQYILTPQQTEQIRGLAQQQVSQ